MVRDRENDRENLKIENIVNWQSHYWLTREVIRDAVTNSPCLQVDLDNLMENQDKIGDNFAKFTHNKRAGLILAKELKEHIRIAVEIVKAAINKKDITELNKKWHENGRKIAEIYHYFHHKIPYEKMADMMDMHLQTTLAEAVAIIKGDCIESYEKGEIAQEHILGMSKYINSKF